MEETKLSLLEVSNVKKTYTSRLGENTVEALKGVNFSVESGEYIAIMGEIRFRENHTVKHPCGA